MTKRNHLGVFLVATLLFRCSCCWAESRAEKLQSVCSVVSDPHKFANKEVRLRGLIIYPTGDAPPPPLVTGDSSRGVTFFEEHSAALRRSKGYKALMDAVWKPSPDSALHRHIWATLSGTIHVLGDKPFLYVSNGSNVKVLPNLTVESAEAPGYPECAVAAGISGRVRVVAVVVDGTVRQARVIGTADPSLSKAALKNVRTWSFYPGVDATIHTTFVYQLRKESSWPPPDNLQVKMDLPYSVVITHYVR